jgi:hypothetical protein
MNKKLYMMILFSSLEIEKFHSGMLDNGIENHFCNHTTLGLLVGKWKMKIKNPSGIGQASERTTIHAWV